MNWNAYDELTSRIEPDEVVVGVVFGDYGWGGYDEPKPKIPDHMHERVLTLAEAEPFMQHWSFSGGYGSPECYATYIWTNKRIFFVRTYDGATDLVSVPRAPTNCEPEMHGGG